MQNFNIKNIKNIDVKDYNKCYNNLYLNSSYGRGVFANTKFKKGDIIEIAPFIFDKQSGFENYIFASHLPDYKSILVLGYGSIYNHADKPNVKYVLLNAESDDVEQSYFVYYADTTIKTNDELKINYGNYWWSSRNITPQLGEKQKRYYLRT